jgi:manganese transport protein
MVKWIKNIGPGTLIAAAFIGPGTVTLCTIAGAGFGFSLLWAMVLSIIATIILQEMAARIGIITQKGLTAVIKQEITSPLLRRLALLLILSAVVIGNSAYEAGNISGASLGLNAIWGDTYSSYFPFVIGGTAFALLSIGSYKVLERSLIVLVLLMSISFILTAIITKPDLSALIKGMLIPTFPENGALVIIGLIGTTVVPYNLFLHASLIKEKWKRPQDLSLARKDLSISIILGGIVSMAIMVSAATIANTGINNVIELAKGLEPLYGSAAKYFLGIGLFAAGITSSITAPLAAAYVARNCFGWEDSLKDIKFKLVWIFILVVGVAFSSLNFKPIEIITFAQVANGMLLPIVALFLLWVVNKTTVLGIYRNSKIQNIISSIIIIITIVLGAKGILNALQ